MGFFYLLELFTPTSHLINLTTLYEIPTIRYKSGIVLMIYECLARYHRIIKFHLHQTKYQTHDRMTL